MEPIDKEPTVVTPLRFNAVPIPLLKLKPLPTVKVVDLTVEIVAVLAVSDCPIETKVAPIPPRISKV